MGKDYAVKMPSPAHQAFNDRPEVVTEPDHPAKAYSILAWWLGRKSSRADRRESSRMGGGRSTSTQGPPCNSENRRRASFTDHARRTAE
jgi:hypothetical protein